MSTFNDITSSYFAGSQRLLNSLTPANPTSGLTQENNPFSLPYPSVPFTPNPVSAPFPAPTVPVCLPGDATGTTMKVQFDVNGVQGTEPITYSVQWILASESSPVGAPISAIQGVGTTYTATRTTSLFPDTGYYLVSIATNQFGSVQSAQSVVYYTSSGTVTAPSGPPTVPAVFGTPTPTTITVRMDVTGITGNPSPFFNILVGTTTNPTTTVSATLVSGTTYSATATGLTPNTAYYFKSVSANGVVPNAVSAVSAPITTAQAPPPAPLTTMAMVPFLIRGPRFNTQASAVLDWYINCDAVGYTAGPPPTTQIYGSWYCETDTSNPTTYPFQSGLVIADQTGLPNQATNSYITNLQATGTKVNVSIGGFNADILGMMSPFSQAGIVAPNPAPADLANSIANVVLGVSSATNPLSWSKTNWPTISFDGINLDFENIGQGGIPGAVNIYPQPQSPLPVFPADLNTNIPNGGGTTPYSTYVTSLKTFLTTLRASAPNKLITMAPLSASSYTSGLTKNTAVNNALNTWAPFATQSTVPTIANYQPATGTGANALLAPAQLALFDDLFVQFYNANADIYIGGANWTNILAQWGFLCLYTQQIVPSSKNVRVNIGLAKGVNSSSKFSPDQPPYFYPAYETVSPPNPDATNPPGNTFPGIGVTTDAPHLTNALVQATVLLNASGLAGAGTFQISDWCSGIGFWAGPEATAQVEECYDFRVNRLPDLPKSGYAYCWTNADYPAKDPSWAGSLPVTVRT